MSMVVRPGRAPRHRAPARRRPRHGIGWRASVTAVAFAAYLSAGLVKHAEVFRYLPVDFTLLMALVVSALVGLAWLRSGMVVYPGVWVIAALFASFAVGAVGSSFSPYGREKILHLITLTLLSAVAPVYLFRFRHQVRALLVALTSVALLVAVAAIFFPDLTFGDRAAAFGVNPIASGRMAGTALLLGTAALIWRQASLPVGMTVAAVGGAGLLVSGSRAPMAAAVFALVVMLLVSLHIGRSSVRIMLVAASLVAAVTLGLSAATENAAGRFDQFLTGEVSASTGTRIPLLVTSWSSIIGHPEGLGWGGYETIHPDDAFDGAHPHNVLVEVVLEGGWIPGLLLAGAVGWAVMMLRRLPVSPERAALLTLIAYYGMDSMFTGDINGTRPLFAILGIAMVFVGLARKDRARLGWARKGRSRPAAPSGRTRPSAA